MANFFNGGSGTGGGASFSSGGVTNNTVPKEDGSGGLKDSSITDDGTLVATGEILNLTKAADTTNAIVRMNSTAATGLMFGAASYIGLKVDANNWMGVSNSTPASQGIQLPSTGNLGWSSTNAFAGNASDTWLGRVAAGVAGVGQIPSATPAARTFQVGESSRAATDSNVAGAAGSIRPGVGTGNGAGSKIVFQRNLMGASGTTAQSQTDAVVVGESKTLSNTSATATSLANISVPSNSGGGCWGCITVVASDGTNFDSETQSFAVSYVNKATVLTIGTPAITASTAASNSGSTTIGITVTAGTNSVDIKVTPVFTTIVPTTVTAYVELLNHGTGNVTIN